MTHDMSVDTKEFFPIEQYINDSYLNYSMYVIMDRALPHIGDGLKPVHRRILYAMGGLNLSPSAKYKKSARTVGDTLGKYHPHGDSACYEAMVIMAQPFSTRMPLVDGQGNWGSQDDPKSFAAMRYTESKLTHYGDMLLSELKQDTVDFKPNFDGSMKEPIVLPAQLPNILINGSQGIAVGMSTTVPPHNVKEVTDACIRTMEKVKTTDDDILDIVTAPDFPTGGNIVTPIDAIRDIYRKGKGVIKVRATYEVKGDEITINSLPYQIPLNKILTEVAELIEAKKLPMITKIKDRSDENNPVQIILVMKNKNVDADAVMSHLFSITTLESTQKCLLNIIGLDGKPKTKSLPEIVREWCTFRQEVFERKKKFRLRAVEARLHILEGLIVAYNNLDEVIRIIREEDNPKQFLMDAFSLSEIQATAILEIRLRQLAKLEEFKLKEEADALAKERDELISLLADDTKIKRAVVAELKATLNNHPSERRTTLIAAPEAKQLDTNALTPASNVTVVLSKAGWIRSAKGHELDLSKLSYKANDTYSTHIETRSNCPTLILGKSGRFFSLHTHELPSAKSVGEPITTKLTLAPDDSPHTLLPYDNEANLLITTRKGNGFQVPMHTLDTRARKGKDVVKVTENDSMLTPIILKGQTKLVLLTKAGRLAIIDIDEVNISNKSQGTRLINIKDEEFLSGEDELCDVLPINDDDKFSIHVGKKKVSYPPEKWLNFVSKRARRGLYMEQRSATNLPLKLSIS